LCHLVRPPPIPCPTADPFGFPRPVAAGALGPILRPRDRSIRPPGGHVSLAVKRNTVSRSLLLVHIDCPDSANVQALAFLEGEANALGELVGGPLERGAGQ
jgi:hypothetical protein